MGSTALTPTGTQSDTSLSATVPAALLIAGTPKVTVKVGTTTSNSLTFSVLAAVPTITAVNPPSTPVQTNPTTNVSIQLTGTGFASNAKVLFNGLQNGITLAAPTSSCPLPTCLSAILPAALLGPYGSTNDIAILNTPPGGGQSKPMTFKVVAPPPPNDNFANAINITTLTFNDVQDSSSATIESADPVPACVHQYTSAQGNTGGHPNGVYNTIWYEFTPTFSAGLDIYTADTRNLGGGTSSYDTVLSIWTGTQAALTSVACNDDINPGIIGSEILNASLTAGTTYYIMVSSFGPPDPNPIALGGKSTFSFKYNGGAYPPPTITSISPSSASSGDPGFTLTVNGSGFFNDSSVVFQDPSSSGGSIEPTAFVSSTQLSATIPASAILFPGSYSVHVSNPESNGPSNLLGFTVNLGTYPVPTLDSISPSPSTVVAGTLFPVSIAAFGSNFALNAVLNVNGMPQPTQVYNHTYLLSNNVAASLFATPGTAQISVSNPTPGGGPSNSLPLTVAAPNPLPTITSITPTSVPIGSPTTITIAGTGFLSGAQVCLNFSGGLNCTYAGVNSSTQLTAQLYFLGGTAGTFPLYVADPAPGGTSPPFNFTITPPPDFSVTSTGTTTQTVTAGQAATFTNAISVAAQNGFSAQVNLSCALPSSVTTTTTCAVNPNTFASGSGTATVTVTTMVRGLVPPPIWPRVRFIFWPRFLPVLLLTFLLSMLLLRLARTRRQRFAGALPLASLLLFLMLQAIGCGGGGYNPPPPPPPPTGTPAGTYAVTVTATSGTLTHTTTLTVVVQ